MRPVLAHTPMTAAAAEVATAAARTEAHLDAQALLTELRALREEVAALRQARPG